MFALNNEPPHQFASGLGAERLEIDLSSLHNARYQVRLRLACYDDALGSDTELLWPAIEDPAVELPFACAPGWRRGLELLDRSAVIVNAEARLGLFAEWLDRDGDPAELASLGIPEWIAHRPMLDSFARRMDEWVGELPDATTDLQAAVARIATAATDR